MIPFIKKDFLIHTPLTYILIGGIVLLASLFTLPAIFIVIISFFGLAFSPFTYEDKKNVNRFLISLSISKKIIVQSRYVFAVLTLCFILLFQLFVQWIFTNFLPGFPNTYDWQDFLLFFSITSIIMAVCYPIIYYFKQIYVAIGFILILFVAGTFYTIDVLIHALGMTDEIIFNDIDKGFSILVEKYIPFQPYLLMLLFTFIIIYLSILLSVQFVKKRDY